jgi:hypothetical protein
MRNSFHVSTVYQQFLSGGVAAFCAVDGHCRSPLDHQLQGTNNKLKIPFQICFEKGRLSKLSFLRT